MRSFELYTSMCSCVWISRASLSIIGVTNWPPVKTDGSKIKMCAIFHVLINCRYTNFEQEINTKHRYPKISGFTQDKAEDHTTRTTGTWWGREWVTWYRISFTGIIEPSSPLTAPGLPCAITHTVRKQHVDLMLSELFLKSCAKFGALVHGRAVISWSRI